MKKRIISFFLSVLLCFSLSVPAIAASSFTDVPATFWAYNEIMEAVNKGITNGYADGTFKPGNSVTNAHFSAFLARAFYSDEYDDTGANPWYKPYTDTLSSHNILNGTTVGSNFSGAINQPINRYDMAQMMYNVLKDKGTTLPSNAEMTAATKKIGDWSNIPLDYRTAVVTCYVLGALNGQNDGTFGGQNLMNRAQGCVVVYRLTNIIGDTAGTTPSTPDQPQPSDEHVLTNGKAVTEANVLELIEELKADYPVGTVYQPVGTRYYSDAIPTQSSHDGCNGWAAMASDYIFGQYSNNKTRVQDDHTKIRPGDIIQIWSNDTGTITHHVIATSAIKPGVGPGNGTFDVADASTGANSVGWAYAEYTESAANNEYWAKMNNCYWVVYTRYPD